VQRLRSDEVTRRVAWTAGLIRLNQNTLSEAVEEFNRYNRRKLQIADPAIADLRVSGTFKVKEPERFAATLERSQAVRALIPIFPFRAISARVVTCSSWSRGNPRRIRVRRGGGVDRERGITMAQASEASTAGCGSDSR
jgi:hypothetical protein